MKQTFALLIVLLLSISVLMAQELNCRVNINYSSLSNTPTPVFQSLQKDVTAFLNDRHWTNHHYESNERIECNVMITITEFNGVDRFTGV